MPQSMTHSALSLLVISAGLLLPGTAAAQMTASAPARIYFDQSHGQPPIPELENKIAEIAKRVNAEVITSNQPITAESIKESRLVYLRTPSEAFEEPEKAAIVDFVKGGGSLLLVLDEERRQSLATTGVNDIIAPFGMTLTPDTEYVHNCGAIAKAGDITKADREIPYSGGRAVEGGTPFAYQLDRDGNPAQPFAAWEKVGNGGRVIVMGEGMATLFLGSADGERLSGVPRDPAGTTYWGKDSAIFMEEVLAWLVER